MKLNIVEDAKNKLIVEIEGADHTLCNSVREELLNDSHVKATGYQIDHPLIGKPTFIIETDNSTNPKKAFKEAIKRLKKINESFKKEVIKELK